MKKTIKCPDCQGTGKIKYTNAGCYGLKGIIFTLGIVNFFDKLSSKSWNEICEYCDGNGIVKVKIKEY